MVSASGRGRPAPARDDHHLLRQPGARDLDVRRRIRTNFFIHRNIAALVPPLRAGREAPRAPRRPSNTRSRRSASRMSSSSATPFCGGVRSCYDMCAGHAPELEEKSSFVGRWLDILRPGFQSLPEGLSGDDALRALERQAVLVSLDNLMSFPMVRSAIEEGDRHAPWPLGRHCRRRARVPTTPSRAASCRSERGRDTMTDILTLAGDNLISPIILSFVLGLRGRLRTVGPVDPRGGGEGAVDLPPLRDRLQGRRGGRGARRRRDARGLAASRGSSSPSRCPSWPSATCGSSRSSRSSTRRRSRPTTAPSPSSPSSRRHRSCKARASPMKATWWPWPP